MSRRRLEVTEQIEVKDILASVDPARRELLCEMTSIRLGLRGEHGVGPLGPHVTWRLTAPSHETYAKFLFHQGAALIEASVVSFASERHKTYERAGRYAALFGTSTLGGWVGAKWLDGFPLILLALATAVLVDFLLARAVHRKFRARVDSLLHELVSAHGEAQPAWGSAYRPEAVASRIKHDDLEVPELDARRRES